MCKFNQIINTDILKLFIKNLTDKDKYNLLFVNKEFNNSVAPYLWIKTLDIAPNIHNYFDKIEEIEIKENKKNTIKIILFLYSLNIPNTNITNFLGMRISNRISHFVRCVINSTHLIQI